VIEGGKLIGIVTIGDVGKAIIADQADTIQVLETYIRGR
jgi:CBS domain-containing protein